ncbi:DEAD/DEAH box helicase [Streptomyces samsunensis]|uniref:RNA helicase n=1 Tax=Streptomyces malaysiensis subsp. samsunensis TaxID=459658 RepID=A0A9X2RWN6_STRMQ|nr:DEAD/DEAH box helicase [Streptomyces samsunensis]MCQ8833442.1 DEAD/DEAH box helicase [Streptomyces samsunensis]
MRPPSPPPAALTEEANILTTFRELGILPETAEALEAVGITSPFPIQEMTLPVALSGTDVIGQAKTGTGKTLGFGLPLLERVIVPADVEAGRAKPEQLSDAPQALVVVPTRELCQQVTNDLLTAGKVRAVRVVSIYGGRAYEPQVEALKKGVDVVVGTPGRLLDLAGQKKLRLSAVKALVLDEADEMLDLGFLPDVEKIIQLLPAKRQTMLFSATMPGQVISLARRYMSQPTHIRATAPDDEGATVANITQHVFRAHSLDKPEVVARVLQAEGRGLVMIFCRTKRTAADIADQLARRGFASGAVHGDLGQGAREQALRAFRNGKVDVLVCTDVAARGIDVEGVTHVINYQSPEDEKTYLHRIGRTGRAGASGTAITLVDWDDIPRWQLINKALDLTFNEPEETYSTSEHLYELLSIPEGTTGVLPRAERTRAGLAAEEIEDLGETGGRAGRGRRAAAPAKEERPARNRRVRRRTRGGLTLDGEGAPEGATAAESAADTAEGATEPRRPRRRRRTRGGLAPAAPEAATAAVDTAEAAQPEAEAADAPAKPRRRRTRGAAKAAESATAAVETAEGATEESASAIEAAETAVATAEAPETVEAVEAPAKPRRRTRAKAAEATETVETAEGTTEAPDADEAAKPRRRTRAKAAEAAQTAVETAEGTTEAAEAPAKPRRRTRAKAAEAAQTAVEAAEGTADAVKAAGTAEALPEAAEAPAKPRRRTRTKAAEATETAEGTTEATDAGEAAKPRRRTRATAKADTADAQPEAEAAEAPAKPRRTRAKAAKAEPEAGAEAEAGTGADEAAPAKPRRRTRAKAAEAAEAAEAAVEG